MVIGSIPTMKSIVPLSFACQWFCKTICNPDNIIKRAGFITRYIMIVCADIKKPPITSLHRHWKRHVNQPHLNHTLSSHYKESLDIYKGHTYTWKSYKRSCLCLSLLYVQKHIDIDSGDNTFNNNVNLNSILRVTYATFWWHFCNCLSIGGFFASQK